jgi:hypothetical protein
MVGIEMAAAALAPLALAVLGLVVAGDLVLAFSDLDRLRLP